MTRRDPYPFHRQGDCQGYTPPPAPPPPAPHWLITIGALLAYGFVLGLAVATLLPIVRWALGHH
jgi:hypothetical protein